MSALASAGCRCFSDDLFGGVTEYALSLLVEYSDRLVAICRHGASPVASSSSTCGRWLSSALMRHFGASPAIPHPAASSAAGPAAIRSVSSEHSNDFTVGPERQASTPPGGAMFVSTLDVIFGPGDRRLLPSSRLHRRAAIWASRCSVGTPSLTAHNISALRVRWLRRTRLAPCGTTLHGAI